MYCSSTYWSAAADLPAASAFGCFPACPTPCPLCGSLSGWENFVGSIWLLGCPAPILSPPWKSKWVGSIKLSSSMSLKSSY